MKKRWVIWWGYRKAESLRVRQRQPGCFVTTWNQAGKWGDHAGQPSQPKGYHSALCVWVIVRRERFIGILSTLTQQIFIEHLPYSEFCSVFRNQGCTQVILPHYSQTLLFWTASRPHPKYQSMYWLNVYMCKISYRADIVNICKVRLGNLEEVYSL